MVFNINHSCPMRFGRPTISKITLHDFKTVTFTDMLGIMCYEQNCNTLKNGTAGQVLPPMASISSKKIRQAFLVLAISNSSRTIRAPYKINVYIHQDSKSKQLLFFAWCDSPALLTLTSPTYFCTSSEPMTLMKQASVLFATARAHRVFPVPGGPNSSTPFGGSIPRLTNLSGW